MSTRGAWGFIIDGEEKIAFNHYDSYPRSLGMAVKNFAQNHSLDDLKKIAKSLQLVSDDIKPTQEQINHCTEMQTVNLDVSERSTDDWYCLLHNAQGRPEMYADGLKFMLDSRDFLKESLWCEWVYIIDLDREMFQVFKGGIVKHSGRMLYNVSLVVEIPLSGVGDIALTDIIEDSQK